MCIHIFYLLLLYKFRPRLAYSVCVANCACKVDNSCWRATAISPVKGVNVHCCTTSLLVSWVIWIVLVSIVPVPVMGPESMAADMVMAFPFTRSSTATGILPVEAPGKATLGQPGDEVSGSLFSWGFLDNRS